MNTDSRHCQRVCSARLALLVLLLALGVYSSAHAQPLAPGTYSLDVSHTRHHGPKHRAPGLEGSQNLQDNRHGDADQAPQIAPYQAARRARSQYGGRVLNVVLEHGASGPYYRVKLLDGGRVRVVHIDAR